MYDKQKCFLLYSTYTMLTLVYNGIWNYLSGYKKIPTYYWLEQNLFKPERKNAIVEIWLNLI